LGDTIGEKHDYNEQYNADDPEYFFRSESFLLKDAIHALRGGINIRWGYLLIGLHLLFLKKEEEGNRRLPALFFMMSTKNSTVTGNDYHATPDLICNRLIINKNIFLIFSHSVRFRTFDVRK
jgi:hypothetical protein